MAHEAWERLIERVEKVNRFIEQTEDRYNHVSLEARVLGDGFALEWKGNHLWWVSTSTDKSIEGGFDRFRIGELLSNTSVAKRIESYPLIQKIRDVLDTKILELLDRSAVIDLEEN